MSRRQNARLLGLALTVAAAACASNPPIASPTVVSVDLDAGSTVRVVSDVGAPGPDVALGAAVGAQPVADNPGPLDAGVSPACHGAELDLDGISASKNCDVHAPSVAEVAGPEDIDIEVVPPKAPIRSGSIVTLEVAFRNRGRSARALTLDLVCEERGFSVATTDARGQRADYISGGCFGLRACGSQTVRIVLSPGGALRARVPYAARTTKQSRDCSTRVTPMKPGRYTISVTTPLRHANVEPGASTAKFREARTAITVHP